MRYDPERHHRRSIRLRGYDYSQAGAYFVTASVQSRECLFGAVADGELCLNQYSEIVARCWEELPTHYPTVELDAFVAMPNHIHAIIVLTGTLAPTSPPSPNPMPVETLRAGLKPAPTNRALSEIVRALKTFSARRINELRGTSGTPVWQRNYYEHVIRNDDDFQRIRE